MERTNYTHKPINKELHPKNMQFKNITKPDCLSKDKSEDKRLKLAEGFRKLL